MKVSVAEAKNKLPELIRAVEQGESVTICRRGLPVVDLIATTARKTEKRTLGTMRDRIQILDENWWKPMSDRDADDFIEGRY